MEEYDKIIIENTNIEKNSAIPSILEGLFREIKQKVKKFLNNPLTIIFVILILVLFPFIIILFFKNIDMIYKINKLQKSIHISYSLDNNLIYPTLVSMISGLENNDNNYIQYHLLLSHDFKKSNY